MPVEVIIIREIFKMAKKYIENSEKCIENGEKFITV
jgi:hypothetical protein